MTLHPNHTERALRGQLLRVSYVRVEAGEGTWRQGGFGWGLRVVIDSEVWESAGSWVGIDSLGLG